MRRTSAMVLVAFLCASSLAHAEEAAAVPAALAVELPTQLLGSNCTKTNPPGAQGKMVICLSKDFMTGGLVGVTVVPEPQGTYEQLVAQMRGSFHESGSLRVISEERFAPATAPDAVGLRAEYQTGTGRKFTWSVSHDGAFTRVLVTVFGKGDRAKIEPEILAKIFGPDRYPPKDSAGAAPIATPSQQGTGQ